MIYVRPDMDVDELAEQEKLRMKRVKISGIRYQFEAWQQKLERLCDIEFLEDLGHTKDTLFALAKEYRRFEAYYRDHPGLTMDDGVTMKCCDNALQNLKGLANQLGREKPTGMARFAP